MTALHNIKVFIVDDHNIIRESVSEVISRFPKCQTIGTAANGLEFIAALENGAKPDIVLLDLAMPEMDGFEVAEWLAKNRPEIRILIFTMFGSDLSLMHFLELGISGFVEKNISKLELQEALLAIAANGYYYSSKTAAQIAALFFKQSKPNSTLFKQRLTAEELKFLRLLTADLSNKDIAVQTGMSIRTVESQKNRLCKKLGVVNRLGLAMFALKNGLASVERFSLHE